MAPACAQESAFFTDKPTRGPSMEIGIDDRKEREKEKRRQKENDVPRSDQICETWKCSDVGLGLTIFSWERGHQISPDI